MKKIIFTLLLALISNFSVLLAQNTFTGEFIYGGLLRDYRIYVPALYNPANPVPLVLNMHGFGSNNVEQEFYGSFYAIADTANFLILLPNGTLNANNQRYFNCFQAPGVGVDDLGYINALLDTISAKYNIDANRIYSTGMSNGGFMSYDLACNLSSRITAIASVTGSMIESHLAACQPSHPMPVMEIHGTADGTVPYTGGTVATFVPIPDLVNFWANFNHCTTPATITAVPNLSAGDMCTAEKQLFSDGYNHTQVVHYKITDGGHTWPGSFFTIGVTNGDINASVEIWRFFRKYTLNGLTTAAPEVNKLPLQAEIYPNPADQFLEIKFADNAAQHSIQVFDAMGKLVFSELKNNDLIAKININTWQSGAYIVRIQEGKRVESQRFVKG
jgi:polyhydroxybutyrate depolymerase